MKRLILIVTLLIFCSAFSQEKSLQLTQPNPNEIIYSVDQVATVPQFKGGKKALKNFINRNFNVTVDKKGEILVAFIVEKDGSLSEIGVLSDAGAGTADEAIRVLGLSPKWQPGVLNGITVRVQYLYTILVDIK